MDFKETMNDLYDVNVKNDNFALLSELNKKAKIAVKTPVGITERFEVEEKVMQGGSWGPLQCSVQMDQMGKECLETGKNIYKYKSCLDIPILAMIAAASKCGVDSLVTNTYIATKVKANKLKFGKDKCHVIHIGSSDSEKCGCPDLKVQEIVMKNTKFEKYLGDIISKDGSIDLNIEERYNKGIGIISQVLALLKEITLSSYYFDVGLLLRDTNLINGI